MNTVNAIKIVKRLLVLALFITLPLLSRATEYTWTQTAAGTTYDWTNVVNWGSAGFPNGAGEVANVSSNVTGDIGIRLQQNITIGKLVIGNPVVADSTKEYTISSGTGVNRLFFRAATLGQMAYINVLTNAGTSGHSISALIDISDGTPLTIVAAPTQRLFLSGGIETNKSVIVVTGDVGAVSFSGNLIGTGLLLKESLGPLLITTTIKDFAGKIVLNSGSIDMSGTAGFPYCPEATINGYVAYGGGSTIKQFGGALSTGNNASSANPGQRLPSNTIILNSGSLYNNGQMGLTNGSWATEYVRDTVSVVRVNSGYSTYTQIAVTNTAGTIMEIGTLARTNNATLYARGVPFGVNTKLFFANYADYMKGGNGAPGSQTMSIIPWIGGRNDGGSTASPDGFATYIEGIGLRALTNSEYASSITAGSTCNVSLATFSALASDTTVNSLKLSGNTSTIGAGRVLTIASGGLMGGGVIGTPGASTAGTLNFGSAEGVIWTGYSTTGTNVIGAVISGSRGVTKTNTGTLLFAGTNIYTGPTTVSAGLLVVGNASYGSKLGNGNVYVSNGAKLEIASTSVDAIANSATVRLAHFGSFNGMMELAPGINETVRYLFLGDEGMPASTYGGTGSGATTILPKYFSGTGILNVTGNAATLGGTTLIVIK